MTKYLPTTLVVLLCFQLGCSNQPNPNAEVLQTQPHFQLNEDPQKLAVVVELINTDSALPTQKVSLGYIAKNGRNEPILGSSKTIQLKLGNRYDLQMRFEPAHAMAEHIIAADLYWDCESSEANSLPIISSQMSLPQEIQMKNNGGSQTAVVSLSLREGWSAFCKDKKGEIRIHFDRADSTLGKVEQFSLRLSAELVE